MRVFYFCYGIGSLIAVIGIYRGSRSWGWGLGALVAAGARCGYIMSRTVGLPGLLVDDEWFEPIGGLSVIAEVGLLSSGSSLWRAQNALGNRPVERGCSLARDSLNAKPDEAG